MNDSCNAQVYGQKAGLVAGIFGRLSRSVIRDRSVGGSRVFRKKIFTFEI